MSSSESHNVLAHVSYVVDPEKLKRLAGADWEFLLSPLRDPLYLTLILATAAATLVLFLLGERVGAFRNACRSMHNRLLLNRSFVPLILRTSLGVALIVAGTKQAIFLPNVPGDAVSTIEVMLGFCLVIGFFVRPCGIGAFVIYCYGLSTSHYMLGTMESAAAGLLVAALGGDQPSADDVLQTDVLGELLDSIWKPLRENVGLVLRLALGATMIWLAVTEKGLNPRVSEAVVVDFDLESVIPVSTAMWVFTVGVLELAVGLLLVLGLFTRTWSIVAFLILTLSFFYFKEEVAGHVTFFGSLLVLMITGAGRCSLDALIAKRTRGVNGTDSPYELA